ncbi:MAG: TRAP transporter small permease [Firmicutes bacterium]|nr:TRAP transporter small permease [Bacillota bacterium]
MKVINAIKHFNRILGYIAGALVFIAACVMLYDVFCRYALNSPSLYAPYIAAFLVLGAAFLGTAYALQAGGHVYVELLVDRLGGLAQKIMRTIGFAFSIVFVFFLCRACFQFAGDALANGWRAQGNLPIPSVILYGVMTFGAAMLIISLVIAIIDLWMGKKEGAGK